MNKLWLVPALCAVFLWAGCDECRTVECAGDNILILNYINADSVSILGGNPYTRDSVSFQPILTNPGSSLSAYLLGSATSVNDLFLRIDNNITGFIIQLDTLPPDTVMLQTIVVPKGDCCEGEVQIDKATLRGHTYELDHLSHLYIVK
jgi:hypothetical protein